MTEYPFIDPSGTVHFADCPILLSYETDQLRQLFQQERDQELGRWRDPENPDMVVYRRTRKGIVVVDERDGDSIIANVDHADTPPLEGTPAIYWVPYRYFQAHPEPKPWHDAAYQEVWELTIDGRARTPAICNDNDEFINVWRPDLIFSRNDPNITAGRRIWPEPEASDD